MPQVNISSLPKTSTITPDTYVLAITDPDNNPINRLLLAQAGGTGSGSGSGKIIVNNSDVVFPQRPRLKFASSLFQPFDDAGNDTTILGLDIGKLLLKTDYTHRDTGDAIAISKGGTGLELPRTGVEGLFSIDPDNKPRLLKTNLEADRLPAATDDIRLGYSVGSRWVFGSSEWVCTSAVQDNAAWKMTTGSGSGSSSGSNLVIQAGGNDLPLRNNLNFVGSGLTFIYDDSANDAIVVQIEQGDMAQAVYDADLDQKIDAKSGGTGLDLTQSVEGFLYSPGITDAKPFVLRNSFGSISAPRATDDITKQFGLGSFWLDGSTDSLYYASGIAENNANWQKIGRSLDISLSGQQQPYKPIIDFKPTATIKPNTNVLSDSIEISFNAEVKPIDWRIQPVGQTLAIRDNMHGATIRVSGSHQVLLPSTLQQGFQCIVMLVSDNSTITFLPEDGNAIIAAAGNELNQKFRSVHIGFDESVKTFYLTGAIG